MPRHHHRGALRRETHSGWVYVFWLGLRRLRGRHLLLFRRRIVNVHLLASDLSPDALEMPSVGVRRPGSTADSSQRQGRAIPVHSPPSVAEAGTVASVWRPGDSYQIAPADAMPGLFFHRAPRNETHGRVSGTRPELPEMHPMEPNPKVRARRFAFPKVSEVSRDFDLAGIRPDPKDRRLTDLGTADRPDDPRGCRGTLPSPCTLAGVLRKDRPPHPPLTGPRAQPAGVRSVPPAPTRPR